MKININRGQNQIGGSIIRIETDTTKIYFDVGINLNESENVEVPQIEGLFCGQKDCDGVFISHYHSDHIGLLPSLLPDIPIFMGEKAYDIYVSAANYRNVETSFSPEFFYDKQKIQIGDISITPLRCDHSAYDSYMFLIESDGKTILYTGDFRANGRLDFESLLSELSEVDAIIIEGTTLSRETPRENIEEETLEKIAESYLKKHTGPAFIMMSAMNIDRLVTAYNVAQKTNRWFLEDVYTAEIASAANDNMIAPNRKKKICVFITKGNGNSDEYKRLQQYGYAKIGRKEISRKPFVMCIRQSMKNYLEKLSKIQSFEDGVLFYAMWKGYMEQPAMRDFLQFMKDKGVKIHVLHTSGHADALTIDRLIKDTNPKIIVPIHTDNAKWFDKYAEKHTVVRDEKIICI